MQEEMAVQQKSNPATPVVVPEIVATESIKPSRCGICGDVIRPIAFIASGVAIVGMFCSGCGVLMCEGCRAKKHDCQKQLEGQRRDSARLPG